MKENNENNNNDSKKRIILTLIAVICLLALVISSTYSYYNLGVDTSKAGKTTISGKTRANASFTLTTPVAELYLYLTNQDMSLSNANKDYYATEIESKKRETEIESATYQFAQVEGANVSEGSKYVCTADVVVTFTGNDTLGEELQEEDLTLHLKTNTGEQDLDLSSVKNTKVTFTIIGPNNVYLEGYLKMHNKETNQKYLANKDINITVETKNLSCTADNTMTGLELAQSNPKGLSEDTSTGMRRFQGTNEDVENYICFGADECSSGDNHMYRIIGIDDSGRLKIMKETSIGDNAWDSRNTSNIQWNEAELKTKLNGSEFLDNTSTYIPSNWKTLIDDTIEWKYGDVTNIVTIGTSLYSTEQSWEDKVTASVGLIYLSDYYLSYSDNIECASGENPGICKTSWMHQTNNGGSSSEYQWTMSRYGSVGIYYYAWDVLSNGGILTNPLNNPNAVRPVFYLTVDAKIVSGSGKSEDPYILEEPPKPAGDVIIEQASAEDLKNSSIGDLTKRFVGTDPNNYICFGSVQKCTTEDDYMYRIIGITGNGELKLQKYSSLGTMKWHDNYSDDVYWNTSNPSSLFTSLNSSGFLTNNTYIPQNNTWKDLILNKTWTIGDIQGTGSGYTTNATEVYNKESATTSSSYKIGLMYLSDYYLAYNDGAGTTNCYNNACSSWMFHSEYEWTMSRYGQRSNGTYHAWAVLSGGAATWTGLNGTYAVRPVFYLSSTAKIKSATGSSSDPYIVEL